MSFILDDVMLPFMSDSRVSLMSLQTDSLICSLQKIVLRNQHILRGAVRIHFSRDSGRRGTGGRQLMSRGDSAGIQSLDLPEGLC